MTMLPLSSLFSKYTLLTVCSVVVISLSDYSQRILLPDTEENNVNHEQVDEISNQLPLVDSAMVKRLVEQYKPYDAAGRKAQAEKDNQLLKNQPINKEEKTVILPNIDQQEGELLALYTDSALLNLKAVITQKGRFALLQKRDHNSGEVTLLKLNEGDSFDGFILVSLNHTSITLARKDKTIELMMYQRNY